MSYRAEQIAFVTMLGNLPRAVGERGARAIWNARIESVLVHGRALSYFLRSKLPHKTDLHYSHYSKSVWNQEAKRIEEVATAIINQASTRLAHAHIGDPDWEPHPGAWPLAEIATVLCHGLRDFVWALDMSYHDRAALFGDRPENVVNSLVAHISGFTPTEISEHPEVGDLTKKLQAYIGPASEK